MEKLKKLVLKKEIIAHISNDEMEQLKGGSDWFCGTSGGTCQQTSCGCPTGGYPTPYVRTAPPRCCNFGCCETVGC